MKRLALIIAGIGALALAAPPAHALPIPNEVADNLSTSNDLLNKIPGLGGPSTRHICVIETTTDRSYCVYVPLP